MFKLQFSTDNAAFEDDPLLECARLLRQVADACEHGEGSAGIVNDEGRIMDINGNKIGRWSLS